MSQDQLELAGVLRAGAARPDAGWLEAARSDRTVSRAEAAAVAAAWQEAPVGGPGRRPAGR